MRPINSTLKKLLLMRRSALSLLFVAVALLSQTVQVQASVGAAGTFAGRNYIVQTGTNLENTGTHFNFINNFETAITVDFSFEAPLGVSINVPSEPVTIAAGATYRFEVSIFTSANTPVGIFPLSIVGRVISAAGGVEVSGSAGLNAALTVQGVPPTEEPILSIVNVTQTSFTVRFTNPDPDTVTILYALETSNFNLGEEIKDVPSGTSTDVTFTDFQGSGIEPNTIYTVFAQSISDRPENSQVVSIQVTTLPAPPPEPDPEDPTPTDPTPPPPTTPSTPPPSSGGGGSAPLTNVLVIELEYQTLNLQVFDLFVLPGLNAYVSVRNNIREQSRIDLTDRVVITGQVNQNVTGQYVLTYTLRYTNLLLVETVTVNVVDTVAPQVLSPSVFNVRVNDPFTYRLVVSDNYDQPEELIITGFPTRVDTSVVGSERFTIFVTDRSGNRTPFLLTVNVRERDSTIIVVEVNDIEVTFEALEGLFNDDNYRIEIATAVSQPLVNSPSWTLFTGQQIEVTGRELVYVRLTDNQGNVLLGVVDITTGAVLPVIPDDTIITGDPWWRVLLRSSNVLVWIIPAFILIGGWVWFFFFLAKRRKKKEEEEVVPVVPSAVKKPKAPKVPKVLPTVEPVKVKEPTKPKAEPAKPKPQPKVEDVEETIEPLIQEPRMTPVTVAAKPKAAKPIGEKVIEPKKRKRKTKAETYAQVVALEQEGIMDDDLLGLEVLDAPKKPVKEPVVEEPQSAVTPMVDDHQIDIFSELGEPSPKPSRKKKKS
jgi:hypothetical protein